MTPTPKSGSNGMPGRSCFRAAPAGSTWSRRDAKVWDALRFVFLMGASGQEHCRRVQIAFSGLPELPGSRTWELVIWNAKQGLGQLGEGDGARSAGRCPTAVYGPISVRYRAGERRGEMSEPAGCGNVGCSSPDRRIGHRSVGLQHGTWGLRRWMTSCSTIAFIPAFTPVSTPTPKWRSCSWRAMRWPA